MAVISDLIKFVKILLPFKVSYNCLQIVYYRVHWLNPKSCYSHLKSKYNLVRKVKVASENRHWTPFSPFPPPAALPNPPPPNERIKAMFLSGDEELRRSKDTCIFSSFSFTILSKGTQLPFISTL